MMRSAVITAERANVAAGPADVFARLVRFFEADIRVLEGLTWRRVGYTFLVAAAFALWTATGRWLYRRYGINPEPVGIAEFFLMNRWGWLNSFMVHSSVFVPQMLALTVADNLRVSRIPRAAVLTIALFVGTAVGAFLVVLGRLGQTGGVLQTSGARFNFIMTWAVLYGGSMALIYFKRRRDRELAVALHNAQLRQVELQKKTLESHLQVLQAQVEPQFLFNTLRRVGELYENDGASAGQMLENLIIYLRTALPQMRTTSSTLGQEVELAQAYLRIERIRRRGRLDFTFEVAERVASAMFPPMVLLPLIDALVVHGALNECNDDEALCAIARGEAETLEVTLTRRGSARVNTEQLESIRARLVKLYGGKATLGIESALHERLVVTLQLPHAGT